MIHYFGVSIADVNFQHIWYIILVFPLLNLNKWILGGWDLSGCFQKLESWKNLEKSHDWPFKRLSPTRKCFKGDHWVVPELKHLSLKQTIIRIWYFSRVLLLLDTQLKQVLQIYTNQSFSSCSYSCFPMKVCESEVYSKHIVQSLDMHCSCLFSEKFKSWYACSHQNLYKISEGKNSIQLHSYIWKKDFIIHKLHKKSSYNHLK